MGIELLVPYASIHQTLQVALSDTLVSIISKYY